jgi:hypothetical protein
MLDHTIFFLRYFSAFCPRYRNGVQPEAPQKSDELDCEDHYLLVSICRLSWLLRWKRKQGD